MQQVQFTLCLITPHTQYYRVGQYKAKGEQFLRHLLAAYLSTGHLVASAYHDRGDGLSQYRTTNSKRLAR